MALICPFNCFYLLIIPEQPFQKKYDIYFFLSLWIHFQLRAIDLDLSSNVQYSETEEQSAATLKTRATCLDNDRERKVLWADEKEMLSGSWVVNQVSSSEHEDRWKCPVLFG